MITLTLVAIIVALLVAGFLAFRLHGVLKPGPMSMALERFFLGNPVRLRYFGPDQALELMGDVTNMRVLEVGVGIGVILSALRERVGSLGYLAGLDIQPKVLSLARLRISGRGGLVPDLRLGTAESLPWPRDSFDWVAMVAMLGELPHAKRPGALMEAKRVAKPQGRILITEFWPDPHYLKPWQLFQYCETAGLHIVSIKRHLMRYSVVVEKKPKVL